MSRPTEKQYKRLVEKIRFLNTPDELYEKLLGMLAEDIMECFSGGKFNELDLEEISKYIEEWRP